MEENNNSNRELSSFRKGVQIYKRKELGVDDSAETVLNVISWIVLFGSFIIGFVSLMASGHDTPLNALESIVLIVGGVLIWSLFQVIINISKSLKNINNGIKVFFQKDLDDIDKEQENKEGE